MTLQYYGIETPGDKPYIWWIADSPTRSWMSFFSSTDKDGMSNPYRLPLDEAIRAYQAIGYKCVKLCITKVEPE